MHMHCQLLKDLWQECATTLTNDIKVSKFDAVDEALLDHRLAILHAYTERTNLTGGRLSKKQTMPNTYLDIWGTVFDISRGIGEPVQQTFKVTLNELFDQYSTFQLSVIIGHRLPPLLHRESISTKSSTCHFGRISPILRTRMPPHL